MRRTDKTSAGNLLRSALTLLRKNWRDGLWVLLGRVSLAAGALISSLVFARVMTVDQYGTYRFLTAAIAIAAVFSLPGAFEVIIRSIPKGARLSYPAMHKARIVAGLASAVVFVLVLCATGRELTLESWAIVGVACLLPLYFSPQLYEAGYLAVRDFKSLSTAYMMRTAALILCVSSIVVLGGSVEMALLAQLTVLTIIHWCYHRAFNRRNSLEQSSVAESQKNNVIDALWISTFAVLPVISENIDKLLLQGFVDTGQLAYYAVGLTIGTAVNGFAKPFLGAFSAHLVHKRPMRVHYMLLFSAGSVVGTIAGALLWYLTPVLYGDDYSPSGGIAAVVASSMGIYLVRTLYFNAATFHKESRLSSVYIANTVTAIISIAATAVTITIVSEATAVTYILALLYPARQVAAVAALTVARSLPFRRKAQ